MNNDDSPFASRRESPGIPASPIDQAIDRAVRRMMQVDPPAGLRRRVMSRIEAPPPRRSILLPAYAVAAAAVVAETPAADSRVARPPQPDAAPPPRSQRGVAPRRTGFRREPIPMPRVADIFGTRTTAVAAAADPTADAVWTAPPAPDVEDSIAAPAPLVVRPVGVPPIETPPIVIAPLVVGRPPNAPPGPPK